MKSAIFFNLLLFLTVMVPHGVKAQNGGTNSSGQKNPVEITADNTLEWDREKRQYTAEGNVKVVQGESEISADKVIASYRENEEGDTQIMQLTAIGNVVITHTDNKAVGQKATYLLDEGKAVLIGDNLELSSPEHTVTAKESFTYWIEQGRLKAEGNVLVNADQNSIEAQEIEAFFEADDKGRRTLKRAEAKGNVVIITLKEMITGSEGFYDARKNTAELKGDVRIKRGQNFLTGSKASVDLKTNISKLYGGKGENNRVKGIFYPGSDGFKNITDNAGTNQ